MRESARRSGDLVACAAAALLGCTGLSGGVSASNPAWTAFAGARAEDETKVGEETMRALDGADAKVEAAGVAGDVVLLLLLLVR